MKSLICKSCGGTMVIDPSARTAVCHYCGATHVLNHEDTDYYSDFYQQMNRYLFGTEEDINRRLNADKLWEKAETCQFLCSDHRTIEIRYLHKVSGKVADTYVSRSNIIYHFSDLRAKTIETFRRITSCIDFPSADTRNLSSFFPNITGGFELEDGSFLLVLSKDEDEYPLRLFGILSSRHVAWIISRLENICCVLEYNGIVHLEINIDNVFINPYTHQASLYGGWWKAVKKNTYLSNGKDIARMQDNLTGVRNTAAILLGYPSANDLVANDNNPKAFVKFIQMQPRETAYEDFSEWDKTIDQAFGGRKFINMSTDDGQIYGKDKR